MVGDPVRCKWIADEAEIELPVGSTLILSDGLIERRGIDLRQSLQELNHRAGAIGTAPLEELCDGLLEGAPTSDDVALLVLRVQPGA